MGKKEQKASCARKTSIGGQALIEGIMMRGPEKSAMAVRDTHGEIIVEEWENPKNGRPKITKLPIIRGVFNFADSMISGYKCLMRSAELSGLEEAEAELEREKAEKKAAKARKKAEKKAVKQGTPLPEAEAPAIEEEAAEEAPGAEPQQEKRTKEEKGQSGMMAAVTVISVLLSLVLVVGLFVALPAYAFRFLTGWFPALAPEEHPALASLYKSVFEGVFKVMILVAYMALVSLMKDIRRTYEYHGAEHKTIFCYESGLPLTVENVRAQRRFHPRCGTSFLILMMIVGIFVSFFIDPIAIALTGSVLVTWLRVLLKLLLIPLIMGIGYELLKLAGRHQNLFTRILSAPGMWLQHITVREPDDGMIECAIEAFTRVIPKDESDAW